MENLKTYGKLIDAGFDWLTFTSTPRRDEFSDFKRTSLEFVEMLHNSGVKAEQRNIQGYEGYKAGETFVGTRADSAIWRTSGGQSRHAAAFARFAGLEPRCTRADLQQTIETANGETTRLQAILRECRRANIRDSKTERQKHAEFYDAGDIIGLTIGGRASTTYLRAYRADIRHPARFLSPSIRFECEWKGDRAAQIWERYSCATNDVTLSCSYVASAFLEKGITEPIQAGFEPVRLPPIGRKGSDEKAVHWIKGTVCKTIARLVKAGYGDELRPAILAALSPAPDVTQRLVALESEIQKYKGGED